MILGTGKKTKNLNRRVWWCCSWKNYVSKSSWWNSYEDRFGKPTCQRLSVRKCSVERKCFHVNVLNLNVFQNISKYYLLYFLFQIGNKSTNFAWRYSYGFGFCIIRWLLYKNVSTKTYSKFLATIFQRCQGKFIIGENN